MPMVFSQILLLSFLPLLLCYSASISGPGGNAALISRQTTAPPIPITDGLLCTGVNLTSSCLVISGSDPTCHDFSGSNAAFANSIKSLLVPPGDESACGLWKTHNCTQPAGSTVSFLDVFIAGPVGANPPVNDLSRFGLADIALSYQCQIIP